MTLLRIADLSHVWVEADITRANCPWAGMSVTITLPDLPGKQFGRVDYIHPYLDGASRTGRVFTVANPKAT